jgi:Flp pilus assembly protein TadD
MAARGVPEKSNDVADVLHLRVTIHQYSGWLRVLDAMHGLARAYQDSEEFDKAIAVAHRITELDPDDVLAHTSLSILYQRKGMVPEAEAEAAKARVLGWKQQLKAGKAEQP